MSGYFYDTNRKICILGYRLACLNGSLVPFTPVPNILPIPITTPGFNILFSFINLTY